MCINYANERLQQFFLFTVLKSEQEAHVREGIPLSHVEIPDNQACIDLLEKPPHGLFAILDSQCKTPNASNASLCYAINATQGNSGLLAAMRTQ